MQVGGILETAIYSANPARTAEFYQRLFHFPELLRTERLIALDVAGRNVLLVFQAGASESSSTVPGGLIPGHGPGGKGHFAFSIALEDFNAWQQKLESAGVAVESTVDWPGGARSLYFRDPEGNLAELITPGFWKLSAN